METGTKPQGGSMHHHSPSNSNITHDGFQWSIINGPPCPSLNPLPNETNQVIEYKLLKLLN